MSKYFFYYFCIGRSSAAPICHLEFVVSSKCNNSPRVTKEMGLQGETSFFWKRTLTANGSDLITYWMPLMSRFTLKILRYYIFFTLCPEKHKWHTFQNNRTLAKKCSRQFDISVFSWIYNNVEFIFWCAPFLELYK